MAQALLQGSIWRASTNEPAQDARGLFPPELTVEIEALACELPATLGLPLSRLSVADVARYARPSGLVARISDSTAWRWLHEALAKRIVGLQTVDHPTEGQLLALVREFFIKYDGMARTQTRM